MSIRFKFRSAASYDEVAIGEKRNSITVRELKARIIRHKNLNLCQDFDLVFSDAVSGQEYNDDDFQIPSGSSVIIKRVPAGMAPLAPAPISEKKVDSFTGDSKFMNPASEHLDDFDDFGADLCPLPDANFTGCDLEVDKKRSISNEEAEPACWRSGLQKLESSELSQAIDKGSIHNENNGDLPQGPRVKEQIKLEKIKNPATQSTDLPSELKCSLCNKFFKDAVMIPCCQHSFCQKCIYGVLVEKRRCPKCSSRKSKVEDLLPNLSLRQAIEHFLESQMLTDGSENDLCKYVPDGESGIQAIDVSCAVTVVQREPELPHSPTATGKGSNQILSESFYESLTRKNTSFVRSGRHMVNLGGARAMNSAPQKAAKQIDRGRGRYDHNLNMEAGCEDLTPVADLMGENQPLPHLQDEADSTFKKKRAMWLEKGGADRHLSTAGRHNKGDRTCFMCGSPNHFIKDCPVAPNAPPMFQRGNCPPGGGIPSYISPYWNGTTFPPYGPFGNIYGIPGMMSYNTSMVPIAPLAVRPYVPAMCGGLPAPRSPCIDSDMKINHRGNMGMQAMERRVSYSDYEIQQPEKRMKLSNEHLDRGRSNGKDDFRGQYHLNKVERSDEHKFHGQEPSDNYSHDSSGKRFKKKHWHEKYNGSKSHAIDERHEKSSHSSLAGRDRRQYPLERSNSEIEHKPRNSYRHSEEGDKHRNRSSKKHHQRREQSDSDSSWSRHQNQKDSRRVELDMTGSHCKHNSYSGSGFEPSKHGNHRSKDKEKDSAYDSRRSRHSAKRTSDEVQDDRWRMVSGSDEDCRDNYRYQSGSDEVCRDNYRHHKRKRPH